MKPTSLHENKRDRAAPQDLLDVIESTKLLKEAQAKEDSPEAKASLPTLAVADLEREIKRIPIVVDSVQGVDVITHDIPSSGEACFFFAIWVSSV